MYNLIIYIYLCGVAIASLFNEKVRKMWRGEREAVRILREKVDPNAQYVWFHAAIFFSFSTLLSIAPSSLARPSYR